MKLPVYWRFLTKTFLQIFVTCTLCAFTLGIVVHNTQFASFIAAGASVEQVLTIIFCSLFRVFSLIIGLTILIAAFLTTYQLSATTEIISLRTSGLSLPRILAPLYYATAFITVLNFTSATLLTPYLRRIESNVITQNKAINPLILLRKEAFPQSEKLHVEMNLTESGTVAKEVLVAFHDPEKNGTSLFIADKLTYNNDRILGENGTFISHLITPKEGFNHLLIANQKTFSTSSALLKPMFTSTSKKREISLKATPTANLFSIKTYRAYKEIIERASSSLIPLTFAFVGISLGLFHPQQLEEKRWYFLIGFVILFFCSFFHAKQLTSSIPLTAFFFFAPHILFISISFLLQKIYQEGRA